MYNRRQFPSSREKSAGTARVPVFRARLAQEFCGIAVSLLDPERPSVPHAARNRIVVDLLIVKYRLTDCF